MANLACRIGFVAGLASGPIGNLSQQQSVTLNATGGAKAVQLDGRSSHSVTMKLTGGATPNQFTIIDESMFMHGGMNKNLPICAAKEFNVSGSVAVGPTGFYTDSLEAVIGGSQTIITRYPILVVYGFYINGLKQDATSFSVSGNFVSIPDDLCVMSTDFLEVSYTTSQ